MTRRGRAVPRPLKLFPLLARQWPWSQAELQKSQGRTDGRTGNARVRRYSLPRRVARCRRSRPSRGRDSARGRPPTVYERGRGQRLATNGDGRGDGSMWKKNEQRIHGAVQDNIFWLAIRAAYGYVTTHKGSSLSLSLSYERVNLDCRITLYAFHYLET